MYTKTRDLKKSKLFLSDLFERLQTDYIDIGMLHYVDTLEDWKKTQESGVLEYMQKLKDQGRFRTLGVSSHSAAVSIEMIRSGLFSVLMFSINPSFDLVFGSRDLEACPARETCPGLWISIKAGRGCTPCARRWVWASP